MTDDWDLRLAEAGRALASEPTSNWGRIAMKPSRRLQFDAVLDALDSAALERLIQSAVTQFEPSLLGSVSAIEALHSAVARRLFHGRIGLPEALLHQLWRAQWSLIVPRYSGHIGEPVTRGGIGDQAGGAEWVADAWAWSRYMPRPRDLSIPAEYTWVFPNWFRIRLGEMPNWLSGLLGAGNPAVINRLREHLRDMVPDCEDTEFPSQQLYFNFSVELLQLAEDRHWSIPPEFAKHVLWNQERTDALMSFFESLSPKRRASLVEAIWREANQESDGWLFQRLSKEAPGGLQILSKWLSPDVVERSALVGRIPVRSVIQRRGWPEHFWQAAARGLLERENERDISTMLHADLKHHEWGPETGEVVESLIEHQKSGWAGSRLLWKVDPERALRRSREAFPDGERASNLFFEGAAHAAAQLLAIIAGEVSSDRPLPAWVPVWLARLLPTDDADADLIYSLLHRARAASQAVPQKGP